MHDDVQVVNNCLAVKMSELLVIVSLFPADIIMAATIGLGFLEDDCWKDLHA
jgi:hypothetical protein